MRMSDMKHLRSKFHDNEYQTTMNNFWQHNHEMSSIIKQIISVNAKKHSINYLKNLLEFLCNF